MTFCPQMIICPQTRPPLFDYSTIQNQQTRNEKAFWSVFITIGAIIPLTIIIYSYSSIIRYVRERFIFFDRLAVTDFLVSVVYSQLVPRQMMIACEHWWFCSYFQSLDVKKFVFWLKQSVRIFRKIKNELKPQLPLHGCQPFCIDSFELLKLPTASFLTNWPLKWSG